MPDRPAEPRGTEAAPAPCECDAPRCERDGCQDRPTPTGPPVAVPGPASVSPADTIRRALTRNLVEQRRVDAMTLAQVPGSVERVPARKFDREALAAVDEWEAVGERDRQQIARLTEAAKAADMAMRWHYEDVIPTAEVPDEATAFEVAIALVRAVLADKEDAGDE